MSLLSGDESGGTGTGGTVETKGTGGTFEAKRGRWSPGFSRIFSWSAQEIWGDFSGSHFEVSVKDQAAHPGWIHHWQVIGARRRGSNTKQEILHKVVRIVRKTDLIDVTRGFLCWRKRGMQCGASACLLNILGKSWRGLMVGDLEWEALTPKEGHDLCRKDV